MAPAWSSTSYGFATTYIGHHGLHSGDLVAPDQHSTGGSPPRVLKHDCEPLPNLGNLLVSEQHCLRSSGPRRQLPPGCVPANFEWLAAIPAFATASSRDAPLQLKLPRAGQLKLAADRTIDVVGFDGAGLILQEGNLSRCAIQKAGRRVCRTNGHFNSHT